MRDDHRVDPVRSRRAEQRQQPRQRAVTQIEDDPGAPMLQHEAAAGPPGLGPATAAAEHHQPAAHALSLAPGAPGLIDVPESSFYAAFYAAQRFIDRKRVIIRKDR